MSAPSTFPAASRLRRLGLGPLLETPIDVRLDDTGLLHQASCPHAGSSRRRMRRSFEQVAASFRCGGCNPGTGVTGAGSWLMATLHPIPAGPGRVRAWRAVCDLAVRYHKLRRQARLLPMIAASVDPVLVAGFAASAQRLEADAGEARDRLEMARPLVEHAAAVMLTAARVDDLDQWWAVPGSCHVQAGKAVHAWVVAALRGRNWAGRRRAYEKAGGPPGGLVGALEEAAAQRAGAGDGSRWLVVVGASGEVCADGVLAAVYGIAETFDDDRDPGSSPSLLAAVPTVVADWYDQVVDACNTPALLPDHPDAASLAAGLWAGPVAGLYRNPANLVRAVAALCQPAGRRSPPAAAAPQTAPHRPGTGPHATAVSRQPAAHRRRADPHGETGPREL